MKLSKLQKALVSTMKICGLDYDTTMTICSGLKTERQQWAMLDWMDGVYDRTGSYPTQAPICKALSSIRSICPDE